MENGDSVIIENGLASHVTLQGVVLTARSSISMSFAIIGPANDIEPECHPRLESLFHAVGFSIDLIVVHALLGFVECYV